MPSSHHEATAVAPRERACGSVVTIGCLGRSCSYCVARRLDFAHGTQSVGGCMSTRRTVQRILAGLAES